MTPNELAAAERQNLLCQLQAAEAALHSNLHLRHINPVARGHMDRALAHVREASVAICETGRARTVDQLVAELQAAHLCNRLRQLTADRVPATNQSIA